MKIKSMLIKLLPVVILATFIGAAIVVKNNPPENQRRPASKTPQLAVAALTVTPEDFQITIDSYGNVKPRTQSKLLPQVAGQITYVSPNFRAGGFFEQGEVLVKLDDRDYLADISIAKAQYLSAQQLLVEEQARVEQAEQDWQQLGNGGKAPDLVLRKPQLQSAMANVNSAKATLTKAELALERSEIVAPYTGRIVSQLADIGQVVTANTPLADIYAVDYVEIRLPIKNNDLPYMELIESGRFQSNDTQEFPLVELQSELFAGQSWQGKVVRTEGTIDANAQQLYVVAQLDDPYGQQQQGKLPIKIGQYVTAKVSGKVINDALVIPNSSIYQSSYVYLVQDNRLKRREISIAWQNQQSALIDAGLQAGDVLVTTALGQVNSGTIVAVAELDGQIIVRDVAKQGGRKQ